jgi:hypothetical protein
MFARHIRLSLTVVLVASVFAAQPADAAPMIIKVLSNRADLVSAGNALVEVKGAAPTVRLDVDGRNMTSSFAKRSNGRFMGLVSGLRNGPNVLTAKLPNGSGARITITNHPIGGPVFAGPQVKPWTCTAGARDKQCNRAPTYEFSYMPTNGSGLQPYDKSNPPDDVSQTTTDNGATVPYIVREEIGVIDRDEYRVAVLYDPAKPWSPWAPQPGYNHKLVITHGASCDTAYEMGTAPDVLNTTALSRGFVVMSHALDNAGHNCNIVTEAEALIMTKEHVIETYGELRYTIGSGCSGGSLVQLHLANAYPGLYQGITPACSFPDGWSSGIQYEDYHLLRDYFEHPERWAPGVVWPVTAQGAVNGHPNVANPLSFTTAIPDKGYPRRSCPGVPDARQYDPETNPKGVRCTFQDYMVNVFGRRKSDGFAGRPWDNTGVVYGLKPLLSGDITPAQFVDVNAKIGGRDIDHNHTAKRSVADPFALRALYRSGAINSANNLDDTAIIDLRGPDPGAFHDVYRTYTLRARLVREHGRADNQILWRGFVPLMGDASFTDDAILAVDAWLTKVEADRSSRSPAQKLLRNRPAEVTDRCTNGTGTAAPADACDALVTAYTSPRIEAGMPFTDDIMKCVLKPLRRSDYYPVQFSDTQWGQLTKVFATGVCDYTKPGVGQQDTVPWQTYQNTAGRVIYGGTALGRPPVSAPL